MPSRLKVYRVPPATMGTYTATVAAAFNSDVVIDTSALAVLAILPVNIRDAAFALFRRVLTTRDLAGAASCVEPRQPQRGDDTPSK